MTTNQTITTIRALGLTASRTAYGEFRVDYPRLDVRHVYASRGKATADDADGAIETAQAMAAKPVVWAMGHIELDHRLTRAEFRRHF